MIQVRHKYITILFFFLITFSGCQKEQIDIHVVSHSFLDVRISANPLALPESDKNTRFYQVPDENTIRETQIIVFDQDHKFLAVYPVINNGVSVPQTTAKRSVYVVANAGSVITQHAADWKPGETSEDDIIESLIQTNVPDMPFAMYAKLSLENGINSNTAISSDGTITGSALLLRRNVAKISVNSDITVSQSFIIEKLMLCNAPDKGYLLRDIPVSSASAINHKLSENNTSLYSFASDNSVRVIMQATPLINGIPGDAPRFYKLAIKDPLTQYPVSLNPNNWYKITITSISGDGHLSIEEAIEAPATNQVTTTIEVRDITMNDHLFGKDNYIGTSNTHYVQYGNRSNQHNYEIGKVRFGNNNQIHDENLNNISIEVIKGEIKITDNTIAELENVKEDQSYSINIEFINPVTEAVVRIKYGHLKKDIYVSSHLPLDYRSEHRIAIPEVLCGRIIISDSQAAWCGLNSIDSFSSEKSLDFGASAGKTLFLCIAADMTATTSRELSAIVTRVGTGTTHISVFQNPGF